MRIALLVPALAFVPVLLPATLASGCFEFEPRVDAGTGDEPEGTISGQISVGDASGQSAGSQGTGDNDLTALRAQLREAQGLPEATAADRITPVGRPEKAPLPLAWMAGSLIVTFPKGTFDEATILAAAEQMRARADQKGVAFRVKRCTGGLYCELELIDDNGKRLSTERTAEVALALDAHRVAGVRHVSRNMQVKGFRRPNDDFYGFQWHHQFVHMEPAWDLEVGSSDLVVAVIDSGAVLAHPDLQARWPRDPLNNQIVGIDLLSEAGVDLDGVPGVDTNPEDPGDLLYGDRSSFHGTHTAGLIGADSDNVVGVAGVTWNPKILPIRVLGVELSGFQADIMNAVFWALGGPLTGLPNNVAPARVINLSLGGAVDAAAQGVWDDFFGAADGIFNDPFYGDPIVVAAVGNDDTDASQVAPANVAGVIAVGAVRSIDGIRAPYSNYGPVVDVMAPGGDDSLDLTQDGQGDGILSTYANDYDFEQGTSMAAPIVTGIAALLVSQNPLLTRAQVETIIKDTADPAGRCTEGCGSGWVDAFSALLLAGGEIEPVPRLAVDTASLVFGDGVALRTFFVVNTGNAPFDFVATVSGAQADLFTVDTPSGTVPAASNGGVVPIVVSLTRNGFESGAANVDITTVGLNPEQGARVDIQFNDDPNRLPQTADTIQVAAYAQKDGALKLIGKTTTTREDQFRYAITGLVAGSYFVYAIADEDDDGTFDPERESVGAYPLLRQPAVIELEEDGLVEGIDFFLTPKFISGVIGGVGSPCDSDGDCTFLPDAQCIISFAGGYCSRECSADGDCGGADVNCELLDCDTGPCSVCLVKCLSDARCRFDDGYICDDFGTCTPEDL